MEGLIIPERLTPVQLINALKWRYATKIFDKNHKIPEEIIETLAEVLRLSPSSIGLQPWKFVIVRDPETRKQLEAVSMEQPQIAEASHLIVTCSLKNIDDSYIDKVIATEKLLSPDGSSLLENFRVFASAYINSMTKEELRQWMAEQSYIALGFLLESCALLKIDACPIEAIDRKKFNEILQLDNYGVEARTAVAIGYRSPDDLYARQGKMRFSRNEVIINL